MLESHLIIERENKNIRREEGEEKRILQVDDETDNRTEKDQKTPEDLFGEGFVGLKNLDDGIEIEDKDQDTED